MVRSALRLSRHIPGLALGAFAVLALLAGMHTAAAQGGVTKAQSEATTKEPPVADASVLTQLTKGGFVIYFRHATTDTGGPSEQVVDLAKCETQRPLSPQGKGEATQIGEVFRKLRIPVKSVMASPFCRAKDTARLAFGKFDVNNDLSFAVDVSAEERKRLGAALHKMLSTPPAAGTNTVIVAHTANLREAAGIWPKPEGVAYIFRPLPGGRFEPVAKMLPGDWARAASGKPAAGKN
jgi:phosphohistidine phosphatase SixA